MARIISVGKDNLFKFLWRKFNSLDLFTRLFITTIILLTIVTPFIVYNYQLFYTRGESKNQILQEIQQLQESQEKLQGIFAKSPTTPIPSASTNIAQSNPAGGFNLIGAIQEIIIRITQIFK